MNDMHGLCKAAKPKFVLVLALKWAPPAAYYQAGARLQAHKKHYELFQLREHYWFVVSCPEVKELERQPNWSS